MMKRCLSSAAQRRAPCSGARQWPYLLLAGLLSSSACSAPGRALEKPDVQSALRDTSRPDDPAQQRQGPDPYPPGRWRLTPIEKLLDVSLRVSHLLIRFEGVPDAQVAFSLTGWSLPQEPAQRTRQDAWRLAEQLAERARRAPERFAELAREFSEDPVTRSAGGSLGSIPASQFWTWPQVLDALAATEPGATTRAVETEFGFHILQLRAPAPERTLSGARIVIGHVDAPFLQVAGRQGMPKRSRAEALTLAESLYQRARAAPRSFAELVARYSEHEDALRKGDFGAWSSREPTPWSRELETLEQLEVGQVAPPLDTTFGFQIIQRTRSTPRPEYALAKVQLRFDPRLPDADPDSRSSVLARARELRRSIAKDPAQFLELQRTGCCTEPLRIIEGRETPALEAALAQLRPGDVAAQPVESSHRYLIVQRLERGVLPPAPVSSVVLPTAPPDLNLLVARLELSELNRQFKLLGAEAVTPLGLSSASAERFARQHDLWASLPEDAGSEQRLQAYREHQTRLQVLLGPALFVRYQQLLSERFEAALLQVR